MVNNDERHGIGIWYDQILFLRDAWVLQDLQRDDECPVEIAEEKPGISIIVSDDFRNDTLGRPSHRTNWMGVQKLEAHRMSPKAHEGRRAVHAEYYRLPGKV